MRTNTLQINKPVVGVRQNGAKIKQNHILQTLQANQALNALTGNAFNAAA